MAGGSDGSKTPSDITGRSGSRWSNGHLYTRSRCPAPASRSRRPRSLASPLRGKLALDLLDQLEMQIEQPAKEADDEQQVLTAVGQQLGARLSCVEARGEVGDVFAKRGDARAGTRLADVG